MFNTEEFRSGRDGETRTHTIRDHKILSLARLPVPPHPQKTRALIIYLFEIVNIFFRLFNKNFICPQKAALFGFSGQPSRNIHINIY